jgi:acyl-CoA reductase-like NAD-dependent aldehyde dehydrogenase
MSAFPRPSSDAPPVVAYREEDGHTVSYAPATGARLGTSKLHNRDDLERCMAAARQAQPGWAATPLADRIAAILRVRDWVVEHADELATTISQDAGKSRVDALATEVAPSAMAADYYARNAKDFLADRALRPSNLFMANKVSRVVRHPWGVVAVFTPWNYPFSLAFAEIVMALLAGNAVILKVAAETQMTALALQRCFEAAGLPPGVFHHLNLPVPQAGTWIFEAGIDKMFFTGSVRVGKLLMAQAAQLEAHRREGLGGNDPMLVCPDADLDRAVAGAIWAGFQNAGQSCAGVERVYVHAAIYDAFLAKLATKVAALRVGVDTDHEVDIGSMSTDRQVETVARHLDDALANGARIHSQATLPPGLSGLFVAPTVLVDVNHQMLVMRDETFGPLLGVMKVDTMDQAVALANDSDLGLTASVWTADRRMGHELARRLQAGAVTINDHLVSGGLHETPWGGFKNSGIGRTHGALGFDEMTQPQVIVDDKLSFLPGQLWWHPHGAGVYQGFLGLLQVLFGRSLGARIGGVRQLLPVVPRLWKR